MKFDYDKHTIFKTLHGSRLYGTHTPESDYDYKGIIIPPKEYFLGYRSNFEQYEGGEDDTAIYDIRKFFSLAAKCNPNIIEILYAPAECVIICDQFAERIINNRHLFLSKKARFTLSGYAKAQLKRMKGHRAWLANPPEYKPSRGDYGLPAHFKMDNFTEEQINKMIHSNVISKAKRKTLLAEKQYQADLKAYHQFNAWKRNRNPERAKDEAKFGVDLKHAYHLIRLMRMCREILRGEGVIVRRPDAGELLAIRRGVWSYERIIEHADELDKECAELYNTSKLVDEPPKEFLENLCVNIVEEYLARQS